MTSPSRAGRIGGLASLLVLALAVIIGGLRLLAGHGPAGHSAANGQRVLVVGHSFHVPMAKVLTEVAKAGGFTDHQLVDMQFLGNSTVTQHWNLADEKNVAKKDLMTGNVDVLTLSPNITLPDEGITKFTELLLKYNPHGRVVIQESWLPFDGLSPQAVKSVADLKRNTRTVEELRALHAPWLKAGEAQMRELNQQYDHQVVFAVPVTEALISLRGKVLAGEAPTIKTQDDLFVDTMGHPSKPVVLLIAYCHYAVIYRKSPIGLAAPAEMKIDDRLNRLLQELAWTAVTGNALSGVTAEKAP